MANAFIDGLYTTSAKVFLMKTGQVKDLTNENNFHPNANVNGLFVHIEDGVSTNIVTINFAPSKKPNWATHDFPLLYIDTIEHTIIGELTPRTFARYFNYMPSQLLSMNLNSSSIMDVGVTVKQQSGVNLLGAFNTLTDLQSEYNNQEVLEGFDENNTIAYVYEVGNNGYYMVDYNAISGLYEWVLKTDAYITYLSTKPYNMFTIKVQRGYQNTKPITPLEDEQYRLLWAYMGSFAGLIEAIGNRVTTLEEEMDVAQADIIDLQDQIDKVVDGTTDIAFDKTGTNLNSDFVEEAIKEVNDKSDANAQDIADMKDGTTTVKKAEQDKNGNDIVVTYETKADATSKLALKEDKSAKGQPNGYAPVGADGYIPSAFIPNSFDDVLEFDTYASLLAYATPDTSKLYIVKSDETSGGNHSTYRYTGTIYVRVSDEMSASEIKALYESNANTNAFTDALKIKLDGLLTGNDYYDKTYIDALKDHNGWESELLGTLSNNGTIALSIINQYDEIQMYAKDTLDVIDNENIRPSLMQSGDSVYFFDDTQAFIMVDTLFGFYAPVGYTLQVVGIKYTELKAEDTSYDNATSGMTATTVQGAIDEVETRVDTLETFKNTTVPATYETKADATSKLALKADLVMVNEVNREQDYRIATIEEAYRKSQNGELTATKFDTDNISLGKDVAPAPLQVKVDGGLLEAKNKFNLTTTTINGVTATVSGNQITLSGTASAETTIVLASGLTAGNKQYVNLDYISGTSNAVITLKNGVTSLNATYNTDYSGVVTLEGTTITLVITNGAVLTNVIYKANINNATQLIANKTYSPLYNKTFDLMSDAEIKAQMDLWVQNGTLPNDNVLAVGMNKRVRSVGKNLFDKSKVLLNYRISISSSNNVNVVGNFISKKIYVKPNTTYKLSGANTNITDLSIYYAIRFIDINNNFISYIGNNDGQFTTPNNVAYIEFSTNVNHINTVQLELGSTATSYVPYANTDLYLQPNKVGYKLPNGVAETIEYRNGKYYYVQRVKKYTLVSGDIVNSVTSPTNVDYVRVSKPIDYIGYGSFNAYLGNQNLIDDKGTSLVSSLPYDEIVNIGKLGLGETQNQFIYIVSKGTYASLAQAQTALAGTVIYYQLATPIETEILAFGNAQGLAGGTTYIDDIMADSNLYTSKYDIENTAYPIKSLDRIVKINADGSQTELAVSSAVVASGGLSFTHPSLVANDIVWIAYTYNVANLFKSNTFVTYYDNPFIAVQPNGTPRRITFSVDNSGVVTVSSVAV